MTCYSMFDNVSQAKPYLILWGSCTVCYFQECMLKKKYWTQKLIPSKIWAYVSVWTAAVQTNYTKTKNHELQSITEHKRIEIDNF